MKIIAGHCQGMKLLSSQGLETRPTSAKVREAVMSILTPWLEGASWLDLYSGTGAMALEAISRGAKSAILVERDRHAITAFKRNLEELNRRFSAQGLRPPPARLLGMELEKAWSRLSELTRPDLVDIVWADPPYADVEGWLNKQLAAKLEALSKPGTLFGLEASTMSLSKLKASSEQNFACWELIKEKSYGDTLILVWQRKGVENDDDEARE